MDYRTTLTDERLNPHLTKNRFRTNDKSHFCGIAVDCIEENK